MAAGDVEHETRDEGEMVFDGDDGGVYVARVIRTYQRIEFNGGQFGQWTPLHKRRLLLPDGRQVMRSGDDTFHIRNTTSPILTERK